MRAAWLVTALGILLGGTACGVKQKPASDAPVAKTGATAGQAAGGWGVDIREPPRSANEPALVQQLAVFGQKRTAQDAFVACCPSDGSDTVEGRELDGQSRLLVPRFGAERLRIFGVPTENGWVCPYFVYPEMGNGFVFEAKPASLCPIRLDRVVVAHKDGTTSTIDLRDVSSLPEASGAVFGCS